MPGAQPPPPPPPPPAPPPPAYTPPTPSHYGYAVQPYGYAVQPYGYAGQPHGYAGQPNGYAGPPSAHPRRDLDQGDRDTPEEEAEAPTPPFFDLAVSTQVPLSVGGLASLELPGRLLLQVEGGFMPPGYGSAVNSLVQRFAGYEDGVARLVDEAFDRATVVRAAGGWRPFPSAGFEIFGGYTYVGLSGSVSPTAVADVVGGDFASLVAERDLTQDVSISSRLHNFHVGLGWRWVAFDHLVIRANLAYMQTVGSSTKLEVPELPRAAEVATPIANEMLGDVYESYVKMPIFGLSMGYRF